MAKKEAKTEKKPVKGPKTFYLGTGRRKSSVARVRVTEGKGAVTINGRSLDDYFTEEKDRAAVLGPLKITDQVGRVDVIVSTKGGGITGQAGAVCQGIARAIKTMFSPSDEQKRYVFHQTTLIKAYRDEKLARERAKAPTPASSAAEDSSDPATGMIKKLRDSGYLTRDARMKERKKYGLRGARRGTQFSKR
jgi:small subunit ribosomal protein S9